MEELLASGGNGCATDQILYNLGRRGPEHDLLPWLSDRAMTAMAYSPVEQGRLLGNPVLQRVAHELSATPAQVALAWVLRRPGVIAIPKAGTAAHARENAEATAFELSADVLSVLDQAFPGPSGPQSLEML
jgi:diketogulonate reductase-like aldo/keto reductase